MPILAIAVTTIECDGHDGAACPQSTSIEYPHPQSVSIRLAKQSGWTVWMETMCPECTKLCAAAEPTPAAPEACLPDTDTLSLMLLEAGTGQDTTEWRDRFKAQRQLPAYA